MQNAARFYDARINDVVVPIEPLTADRYQIGMAKERQMLGNIGLWNTECFYEILYGHLLLAEKVQYLKALWISKNLVGFRISAIGSSWKRLLYFFS